MLTRPRILTLITVAAVSIIISGTLISGAWFSDHAETPGAIITSGTLDLQVSGGPLSAGQLAPGAEYVDMGSFCASNAGSTALKYRGLFEAASPAEASLLNFLTMRVEQGGPEDWRIVLEAAGDDLAAYFKFSGLDFSNRYILDGSLAPGEQACYRFWVKLAAETPNEEQNRQLNFILSIFATQTNNPVWE